MNIISRISKNTGALLIAQITEKVFNFFMVVIFVRYLTSEVFGQYGFIAAYVVLFNVIISLGLSTLCTREISRRLDNAPQILTAVLVPMVLSSIIAFPVIILPLIASKPGQSHLIWVAVIAVLEMIITSFANIFDTVPRSYERMSFTAIPRIVRSALLFIFCYFLLKKGMGLAGLYSLIMFAGLLRLLTLIMVCKTVFGVVPSRTFDSKLCKYMLKESYPLAVSATFIIIYYKIDAVMLNYMRGDKEVGLYVAASTLVFGFLFLASAYHQATYPVFSKIYVKSLEELRVIYRLSIKYLSVLGLPISCGILFLAPQIILTVYREEYLPAAPAMRILTVALFFMFVNGLMGYTLVVFNSQKTLMKIFVITALINVILNLVLIPSYGLAGAAFATVISEICVGVYCWINLKLIHNINASMTDIFRTVLCCAGMGVYLFFISSYSLFWVIPSSALIYFALIAITGTIGKKDFTTLKKIILTE